MRSTCWSHGRCLPGRREIPCDHDLPDDIEYSLAALGHDVLKLREQLTPTALDEEVLGLAAERDCGLITCNRDDFLAIVRRVQHAGLVIRIRRRTQAQERAALVRLLDTAGESGLRWQHQLRVSNLNGHKGAGEAPPSCRKFPSPPPNATARGTSREKGWQPRSEKGRGPRAPE